MIDPSYLELVNLLSRPFVEDFEPRWQNARAACFGFFMVGTFLLLLGWALGHIDRLIEPAQRISNFGLLGLVIGFVFYLLCGWKAYRVNIARQLEKESKIRSYEG